MFTMGDYEAKGQDFLAKADKKLKSMSFFGNKYEEATELYEKAGNNFKLAKNWQTAGEVYRKLAEVQLKLDSKHEAAQASVESAKAFLKVDRKAAISSLQQAVQLYTDMGRLTMAARQLREIAELEEKEDHKEVAMEFYTQAADLFAGEESTADANKCRLKVAQFSAELNKYPEAVDIYEDIAKGCVDNNLLKYSAKGYLLNAGICRLCSNDVWEVRSAVDKFSELDPNFAGSREDKFLRDLADAVEEGDVDKFTDVVADFDSLTRLDAWKTTLLLRVKKRIPEEGEVSLA